MAQPILTDGGPPAWTVDKRAELGRPSSREKGWPAICKSGPRLCSFTAVIVLQSGNYKHVVVVLSTPRDLEIVSCHIKFLEFMEVLTDIFV